MELLAKIFWFKPYLLLVVLLSLPLGFTLHAWQFTADTVRTTNQAKFKTLAQESEEAFFHRMDSYHQALLGGRAFLASSELVTRAEWRSYVDAISVLQNFPGINGIGLIDDVGDEDLVDYVRATRADGFPSFEVRPTDIERANFVIRFIEPVGINMEAVGLNIAFEDNRFNAAAKARDSGKATITKRIPLVQDAEKTPGFLLLLPLYAEGAPTVTQAQRREAFKAWIYAPFIGLNFFKDLTTSQGSTLNLQVYDGTQQNDDALIYQSNADGLQRSEPMFQVSKELEIMQQKWVLVWSSTSAFERLHRSSEPMLVLLAGLLFTGICGVVLTILVVSRATAPRSRLTDHAVPALAFCLVAAVAFYLQNRISDREIELIENVTFNEGAALRDAIVENVARKVSALDAMAARWSRRGQTPQAEWLADAQAQIAGQTGLTTVEWVDNSFHVRWVEPLVGNEAAVGLNIVFNEERRRALESAASKNSVTLTPPLDLVQGYKAILSYSPIRTDDEFEGFIVGIFSIEALINEVLSQSTKGNFGVRLEAAGAVFHQTDAFELPQIDQWIGRFPVKLFDQEWQITVVPSPAFIKSNTSQLSRFTLAIGLVLATMIAALIVFAQRSRQQTTLLVEKENILSTFVRHTPAAVAMLDSNLRYIAASDQWYVTYGLDEQRVIGRPILEVFPEISTAHATWYDLYMRALDGEIIKGEEKIKLRFTSGERWHRYEIHPWYKGGGERGGLITFTENITARKQVESMKDEFISTVNHELRTPLTSIQAALGLLRARLIGKLDDKGVKLLTLSYDNSVRLGLLVNDILDTEKIAAGKMSFDLEVCEMNALVDTIAEQSESYADSFGVSLDVQFAARDVYCHVDRNRFNQALTNILSNAVKFSNKGDTVTVALAVTANQQFQVSVQDNGPGIAEDFKAKIFEKFAQADSSSTRAKGGTGLGLSITKSIIEAFDGTVTFASEEGSGTTFYFNLPLADEPLERKVG